MILRDYLDIERLWRRGPVVSVLRFEGVIMPRVRRTGISLATHARAIERAFSLRGVVAVAIVVNSPGGSPVQSALLFRRIRQLADEKGIPVVAFAEDVAASGGYWLALAGDEIFGEETSLIGSIGVISAGFGLSELIKRLGVERRLYTAGAHKSLLDPFLPEDPADVERLTGLQQDIHRAFKEHVRRRRGDKIDGADESLFNGDVLTGHMAAERGLIDGIGELRAVMRARYGDRVRLRPVAAERRRPIWGRLPFMAREPFAVFADLAEWAEARLVWARFGL
jgi:signal peptide peptidase SppA